MIVIVPKTTIIYIYKQVVSEKLQFLIIKTSYILNVAYKIFDCIQMFFDRRTSSYKFFI